MKRILAFCLVISILLTGCSTKVDLQKLVDETAAVLLERVPQPAPGSRDWTVLALARWDGEAPEGWFEDYEARLEAHVKECGGVLEERKYTEYSRTILVITALGSDASDFAGFDLTAPLENFGQTIFQGINGAIYALLALDSGGYGSETIREQYVAHLLEQELPDGGWSLMGGEPEADVTAMALQALANYADRDAVQAALERGGRILETAEYTSSESVSQAILAFAELGKPEAGIALLDTLLEFRTDDGLFRHIHSGDGDILATEQAFCALAALQLAQEGGSFFRMGPET